MYNYDLSTDGGGNYTIGQYNITLPIGATRVSLYVPINNDNTVEVNEKFDLVIDQFSLPTNVNAGSVYKATVSIMDDDGKNYYNTLSFIAVAMNSRDQYGIIGLCEISHFINQPCRNFCLEKHYKCVKVAETMQYLG